MRDDPRTHRHKEIWRGIVARCTNPNATGWENYGGRGVTICDRWNPKAGGCYENFISDMGYRPTNRHQLDKEAVDPNNMLYGPEHCRWVHRKFNNAAERKRTRRKTILGEKIYGAKAPIPLEPELKLDRS